MTNSIANDVMAIIAKNLRVEDGKLALTDRLEDLGVDSFSAVEMIFDLEEKFNIQIPYNANEARPNFETVGQVVDAVKTLLPAKP